MSAPIRLSLLLLTMLLTACKQNSAHRADTTGPGNGGGGDPLVAAFLDSARSFCDWMQTQAELSVKAAACRTELSDLADSVNTHGRVPRVYSDDKPALDNNIAKDAVTDLDTRRVHINSTRWRAGSKQEHEVIAAMEMALLLDIPERYNLGKKLTEELAASLARAKPEEFESFFKWALALIDAAPRTAQGRPFAALTGKAADQTPCTLFVTKNSRELKMIYLSLGLGPGVEQGIVDANNFYIGGLIGADSSVQMTSNEIHFRQMDYETVGTSQGGSPIAEFSERRLRIELNQSGQVIRATGTSSRSKQPVICTIKPG